MNREMPQPPHEEVAEVAQSNRPVRLTENEKQSRLERAFQDQVKLLRKKHGNGQIHVEALRPGFYNNERINTGDKFTIQSADEFGRWMKAI